MSFFLPAWDLAYYTHLHVTYDTRRLPASPAKKILLLTISFFIGRIDLVVNMNIGF